MSRCAVGKTGPLTLFRKANRRLLQTHHYTSLVPQGHSQHCVLRNAFQRVTRKGLWSGLSEDEADHTMYKCTYLELLYEGVFLKQLLMEVHSLCVVLVLFAIDLALD